jgi:ankyrin repeat protein
MNYFESFSASAYGYKDIVEYLLSKGAEVNVKDYWGATPFHTGK